jgi:hypothetical protein
MLDFPLTKAETHIRQHHSIVAESWRMLAYPLAQALAHLENHPTMWVS